MKYPVFQRYQYLVVKRNAPSVNGLIKGDFVRVLTREDNSRYSSTVVEPMNQEARERFRNLGHDINREIRVGCYKSQLEQFQEYNPDSEPEDDCL